MPRKAVLSSLLTAIGLALAGCSPEARDSADGGVLTLFGEADLSRCTPDFGRGAVNPEADPLFSAYGLEFDQACALPYASLSRLSQFETEVDFPLGGPVRRFSGPRLAEIIALAQFEGDSLRLTALDGYQIEIRYLDANRYNLILAVEMDGEPLTESEYGPAMLVWPRRSNEALAEMNDDDFIYGVFAIESFNADSAAESPG